jgi:hypothetical protein
VQTSRCIFTSRLGTQSATHAMPIQRTAQRYGQTAPRTPRRRLAG